MESNNIGEETMPNFDFQPSRWVPFRDKAVLDRVRNIKREDITSREPGWNPGFNPMVVPDDMVVWIWATDMLRRIKASDDENTPLTLVLPNPALTYKKVAYMINQFKVNCRNLHVYIMDEYADQDGNIAPPSYPPSFFRSTMNYLYNEIDPALRPPIEQMHGPTNENLKDYGKMIADRGGADAIYTGPGWVGHVAFIEPANDESPEFKAPSLEEWMKLGPRIVTLNPFTIAQNSLHGSFGLSGDIANVPPKAFTIGPAEVAGAKFRMEINALNTMGTFLSWQRLMTRLILHGPVTPLVPTSIHQLLKTDFYMSETTAANIEPTWEIEY